MKGGAGNFDFIRAFASADNPTRSVDAAGVCAEGAFVIHYAISLLFLDKIS